MPVGPGCTSTQPTELGVYPDVHCTVPALFPDAANCSASAHEQLHPAELPVQQSALSPALERWATALALAATSGW